MASENASPNTSTKTAPFPSDSHKLPIEIKRQHSYTTLERLMGPTTGSPTTPSPCGAVQMKKMVERLEEIDTESRDLLQTLFSMLENDTRLERYVRRRMEDTDVGPMWELVEQIMSTTQGHVDVDAMLNNNVNQEEDDDDNMSSSVRELRMEGEVGDGEMRMERFKIRTFDSDDLVVVEDP